MRWTAYASTIAPRQLTRIVNLLTTGYGYAYLAARAAERNRSADVVLARLQRAEAQLAELCRILCPEAPTDAAVERRSGEPPASDWNAFLSGGAHDLGAMARLVADAVVGARWAADAVQEDEDLEQICKRLIATRTALTRLLDIIQLIPMLT